MNGDQENQFSMFKAVKRTCDENISLITPITALFDAYTLFVEKTEKIQAEVVLQETPIEGVAVDKHVLKYKLANYAFVVASIIKTFAVRSGNNTLKLAVSVAKSTLEKDRDSTLVTDSQRIAQKADENIADLAAHGLTPAMMTEFKDLIVKFDTTVADPTHALDHRVVNTQNVDVWMKEANDLLRFSIDPNMELFSITNPQFYMLYQASRQIIDLHGPGSVDPTGNLKGVVRDATTNNVIEGVQIVVIDTEFAVETNGLGEYTLALAPGTYGIRAMKDDGYDEKELTGFVVVKGQDTIADILLEPLE